MRRTALAALSVFALACSSSGGAPSAPEAKELQLDEPQITFVQLVGPADQQYPRGDIEVKFGIRVQNTSADAITLRRVELQSFGSGGPYRIVRNDYFFNEQIEPSQAGEVTFWAKAQAAGDPYAIDARAPVSVRGSAYFDSEAGAFRTVFSGTFSQSGRTE